MCETTNTIKIMNVFISPQELKTYVEYASDAYDIHNKILLKRITLGPLFGVTHDSSYDRQTGDTHWQCDISKGLSGHLSPQL